MLRRHIWWLAVGLLLFLSCGRESSPIAVGEEPDSLVVLFTGDVLLDRGVRQKIERHGVDWLFRDVSSRFHRADATVIDLECPITNQSNPLFKRFVFRADTAWTLSLRQAGITHAALANNHTNDQGVAGVCSTVRQLQVADIVPMGYGVDEGQRLTPTVISKDSMRMALFNATFVPLENWNVPDSGVMITNNCDVKTLASAIAQHRSHYPSDCIVVVLHWGFEFRSEPSLRQRREALALTKAGADVIVGHHPHVVQPIERLGSATVLYSLGNFVFDQHRADGNIALLAEVVLKPDTLIVRTNDVLIEHCRPHLQ